jgi:hypothetical protein
MAQKKLRYGKGKASIEIDGTMKDMLEKALREVAPMTMAIIEAELEERVKYAKDNWIVRGNKPVKNRDGTFRTIKQKSERSIDKFSQGIRIVDGGKAIEGFFRNDATYAYAIKVASYSKKDDGTSPNVAEGKRIAIEAMWKPAKAGVPKLIKRLSDAYVKEQKKVK